LKLGGMAYLEGILKPVFKKALFPIKEIVS
jgi:hypothetical protein